MRLGNESAPIKEQPESIGKRLVPMTNRIAARIRCSRDACKLARMGIPTVMDRVVQQAVRNGIEPIFEAEFHDHSYGFRPGHSAKDALYQVAQCIQHGHEWVVDADLKSFFDTIDHSLLMQMLASRIADSSVLQLIQQFLTAGVLHEDGRYELGITGTPQGGVMSPLLANIYLNGLDHALHAQGFHMYRYADDFVIYCATAEAAQAALALVQQWTTAHLLTLHPEKTKIIDMAQQGATFDFLGFTLKRWTSVRTGKRSLLRHPRATSVQKLRDSVRKETKRCNGRSLPDIIAGINPNIRGWKAYFCSSHPSELKRHDGWIRMRLRSILRKRQKGHGRGHGLDHFRWTNAFFDNLRLVTCTSS